MLRYECDQCGACCRGHLIVEADLIDLLREPRLFTADPRLAGFSLDEAVTDLDDEGKVMLLACGTERPCPFLDGDNRCTIYPTRPNECVAMQPGDEQCQEARRSADLAPLEPVPTTT